MTLSLKNTSPTKGMVAFKVKTTMPKRYLVRPNQGVLGYGTGKDISIVITCLRVNDILHDSYVKNMEIPCSDKFLVQSLPLSADQVNRQPTNTRTQEEHRVICRQTHLTRTLTRSSLFVSLL